MQLRHHAFLLTSLFLGGAAHAQDVETFTLEDQRIPNPAKPAFQPWSALAGLDLSLLPAVILPSVDQATLANEDAIATSGGIGPMRVGVVRAAAVRERDGVWHDLGDGTWLFTAEIRAIDALALRLHFSNIDVPAGASLVVFSPRDPSRIGGPIDGRGPLEAGEIWTPTLHGDRARIEYRAPGTPGVQPTLGFTLDAVLHVYRDPALDPVPEGGCTIDSSCVAAISTLRKAVGRINYIENGGGYHCTGQLLQTTAGDFTPYFQTANHCIAASSVANTAEIHWLYQSSTCNGSTPALADVPTSEYCSLISTQVSSDSTLLLIQGTLPAGLAWAGWTSAVQSLATLGYGIHHPQGTPKKVSTGLYTPAAPCGGTDHFGVNWSQGGTDQGSSGSGFFKASTSQFVGQLHCGIVCDSVDSYGRFADFHPQVAGSLSAGPDDFLENNDSCGGHPDIAEGSYSSLVVKSDDDDWYEISVPAGAKLTVDLSFTHTWGDIDAQLWVNCGDANSTDSSTSVGNTEKLEWINTGTTSNTVAWRVYLYNDTRAIYGMTVSLDPENDTCATAQTITDNVFVAGTLVNSTHSITSTCDLSATARDVWFRYVPTLSGTVQIQTTGSSLDTVVTVYSECSGSELGCNDDALGGSPVGYGTLSSYLTLPVTLGEDYYIRVAGYNGLVGHFQLRVDTDSGAPYCLGDGVSGTNCPCSNTSTTSSESGCRNSTGVGGQLYATGVADVSNDGLTLRGANMPPNSTCLYFQGTTRQASGLGAVFGDGLRCAGGTVIRLGTETNNASGISNHPNGLGIQISVRGNIPLFGGQRFYQCWYRNAVSFCTASTFNVSNGYLVDWRP